MRLDPTPRRRGNLLTRGYQVDAKLLNTESEQMVVGNVLGIFSARKPHNRQVSSIMDAE
jgi:hypothetical protein